MLEKMKYINHLNEEVVFGEGGILISGNDVRDFTWTYNSQYSKIFSFTKGLSKKKIPFVIYGSYELANRTFEKFERDVLAGKTGKLYVGDYYINGYFFSVTKVREASGIITGTLEFVTAQPSWIKEVNYIYRVGEASESVDGVGYPYGFPYDFASNINSKDINNTAYIDSDFIITIYGQALNPIINIAEHIYQVSVDVNEREYLTINSYDKTIVKTDSRGNKTNVFASRNLDSYIFQKIPTGQSKIITSAEFNFDIKLLNERSEPEWI